ncbi:MAG: hypothetical protein U9Q33_08480 [Campylobacterota bacterium]|nr:hypothetical protein [Campylobacterota bacterium]
MEVIVFLLTVLTAGALFYRRKDGSSIRSTALKKEDIVHNYEKELKELMAPYENDKKMQIKIKKEYLQKCNSELSRNVFFDEDEAKEVLEQLSQL